MGNVMSAIAKKVFFLQVVFFVTVGSVSEAQENALGYPALAKTTIFDTFEVEKVKVVPVVSGLSNPFGMAFRKNGDILITERYTGKIKLVRNGELLLGDVGVLAGLYTDAFRAGLMAIAIHPDDDSIIYLTHTKAIEYQGEQTQTVALSRGKLVADSLTKVEEIFVAEGLDTAIAGSVLLWAR
jgi:glucose/arabinose dehydrogenase